MISEEFSTFINYPTWEDCHVGRRLSPRNDGLLLNPERLHVRSLLLYILQRNNREMKLSDVADSYNDETERSLTSEAVSGQLKALAKSGDIEKSKRGFYKLASKQNN